MLRAEYCICGTSTTGTGTLTLAACPQPPGGTDLYQAFQVQGLGTAVAIPVSYTIVEYTGSDFQTASKQEKGVGLLDLGASITATTLARTTVQQTATGMSTATPTYDTSEPTAISIATAANALVFIGASAADLLTCSPYFDRTLGASDGLGALPVNVGGGGTTGNLLMKRDFDYYHLFEWRVPMLVKRLRINLDTNWTNSRMYGRLYSVGLNARPTKLLYDFGTFAGFSTFAGIKATSATGSGFYLQPGEYFIDLMMISSSSGNAIFSGFTQAYNTGRLGYASLYGSPLMMFASSASTAAGDPANVTSLDFTSSNQLFFTLSTT